MRLGSRLHVFAPEYDHRTSIITLKALKTPCSLFDEPTELPCSMVSGVLLQCCCQILYRTLSKAAEALEAVSAWLMEFKLTVMCKGSGGYVFAFLQLHWSVSQTSFKWRFFSISELELCFFLLANNDFHTFEREFNCNIKHITFIMLWWNTSAVSVEANGIEIKEANQRLWIHMSPFKCVLNLFHLIQCVTASLFSLCSMNSRSKTSKRRKFTS